MKQLFLTIVATIFGLGVFAQNDIGYFIKTSASLNYSPSSEDTIFLNQEAVISVSSDTADDQSRLIFEDANGERKSVNIYALVGDSTLVKPTLTFTVNDTDAIDTLRIGATDIAFAITPANGNVGDFAQAIADSIDATASSPNFAASADSAAGTVTISFGATSCAAQDSAFIFNGYRLSAVGGDIVPASLSGGYYAKNLSREFTPADIKLFSASQVGVTTGAQLFNANRLVKITGGGSLNTTLYFNGKRDYTVDVTENRTTIQTRVNAL
jgi:hypothetical protein